MACGDGKSVDVCGRQQRLWERIVEGTEVEAAVAPALSGAGGRPLRRVRTLAHYSCPPHTHTLSMREATNSMS